MQTSTSDGQVERRSVLSAGVLLGHVEDAYAGRTGAVLVGPSNDPVGTLFLEGGRLCWAVANGMRTRLTDLLRASATPALSQETLEALYQRCRRERRPLGEALVEGGLVTAPALRAALLRHTAEAVVRLSQREHGGEHWVGHRGAAYDARFTFSAAEVWCAGGAMVDPELAAATRRELEAVAEPPSRGVGAIVRGGEILLVAQCGEPPLSIVDTLQVAAWADEATSITDAMHAQDTFLFTTAEEREGGAVAWRKNGVVHGVLCDDRSSLYVTAVRHGRRVPRR